MPGLANATVTAKVIRALKRAGFEKHEGKGHTVMSHPDGRWTTIPRHRRVKVGLLRTILKQIGMSEREYLRHYR